MQSLRSHAENRFRDHVRTLWRSRGGGFYGFVAALTFIYIEGTDLAADIATLPHAGPFGLGSIIGWGVGRLVDAIVNGVRAAIWPAAWIGRFGVSLLSAGLLAACWLAYRAARPALVRWLGEDPAEKLDPAPQPGLR